MMTINSNTLISTDFTQRLALVYEDDPHKVSVKVGSRDPKCVRFVTYWELSDEDIELAIKKITFVIKEFDDKIKNKL